MRATPAWLVAVGLAGVLSVDTATVALHRGSRDSVGQAAPAATPAPTTAPTSQVTGSPQPRPKPYRLMFSTTLAAPTAEARHTRVFTVLPNGQGKLRRIGASTVPLSQVNPVTGLVVTTKVLSQSTSWMPSAGYCNAWSCPESGTTSTEQGLVLRNPRNGTSRILTRGGYDDTPVWSPDGSTIAYDSLRRSGHVIALVGPAGEDLGTVARAPAGSFDSSPVWAPNNQAVAAVRTNSAGIASIVVLYLDGRPRRVLATARGITGLAWSPDGRSITYARPRIGAYYATPQFAFGDDLWVVSVATRKARQLTHLAPVPSAYRAAVVCRSNVFATGVLSSAVYSPDGRFIAFASTYAHRGRALEDVDVQVLDLRSGHLTTSFHTPDPACFSSGGATSTRLLGWTR